MLIIVPGCLHGDEVPKKLKQNVNAICVLTLMVAFQDGSIHDMSPLKWGTITKLGVCLKPSLNMMQLGEQMSTGNL